MSKFTSALLIAFCIEGAVLPKLACAQGSELPVYLRDRGFGIPASISGAYLGKGELVIYPSFEHSIDNNREYQPVQFGFGGDQDFLGKYRSSERLVFIGFGLTNRLALEFEAAYTSATFIKSPSDTFGIPARIEETGFGDIEGQVRVRCIAENDHHPEVFSYLEITAPSQKNKLLIGNPDLDLKPGVGLVRGFSWGTMTLRTTLEWNREVSSLDVGETALEYLKRLSPAWRVYLGVTGGEGGAPDEWDLVSGVQWHITDYVCLRLDNALGITPKATDWAPQIGFVFSPILHRGR